MFLWHYEHVAWVDRLNIHKDNARLVLKDNTCGRASFEDVAEYTTVHVKITESTSQLRRDAPFLSEIC